MTKTFINSNNDKATGALPLLGARLRLSYSPRFCSSHRTYWITWVKDAGFYKAGAEIFNTVTGRPWEVDLSELENGVSSVNNNPPSSGLASWWAVFKWMPPPPQSFEIVFLSYYMKLNQNIQFATDIFFHLFVYFWNLRLNLVEIHFNNPVIRSRHFRPIIKLRPVTAQVQPDGGPWL